MRYGILADIHGNHRALTAIVGALEPLGVDCWVNLGDLVGYGPEPGDCVDWARGHAAVNILGNHDYAVLHPDGDTFAGMTAEARLTLEWTRGQLSADAMEFLGSLPRAVVADGMSFFHASLEDADPDYWPYLLDRKAALFNFYLQETLIGCCGHGHIPLAFAKTLAGLEMRLLTEVRADGGPGYGHLWSPGSVGQSRDGDWRAAGLWFDATAGVGRLVRAEYDYGRVREGILARGWPESLAGRLGP